MTIHASTIRNQSTNLLNIFALSLGKVASMRGDAIPNSRHRETPVACKTPAFFCRIL